MATMNRITQVTQCMALAILVAAMAGCHHFIPPEPNDAYMGDIPALPGDRWIHDGAGDRAGEPGYYRD